MREEKRARIAKVRGVVDTDGLDARDRAGSQKLEDAARVEGMPDGKLDAHMHTVSTYSFVRFDAQCLCAQLAGTQTVDLSDGLVELTHRTEPGGECHIRHTQVRARQESTSGLRPACPRQRLWTRAKFGGQQSVDVAGGVAESFGKSLDALTIHHPI